MYYFPTLLLLLLGLSFADLLGPYRDDGFSDNVLANKFPDSVSIQLQAAHLIPDGSLVAAGTVLVPAAVATPATITTGPGLLTVEDTGVARLSAFVTRILPDGNIKFAIRLVPVKIGTTVSLAVDKAQNAFITGATTGIVENGTSSGEAPFIAKVSDDGKHTLIAAHPHVGNYYVSIVWRKAEPDVILLVSYATGSHKVFSSVDKTPTKGGLVGVRVDKETLKSIKSHPMSVAETSTEAELVLDKFWDMCLSTSENILYFAVKRQVVKTNWMHSFTPSVLGVHAANFSVMNVRSLPKDLQLTMKLGPGPNGVYAAYVSRTENSEHVVVHKLSHSLEDKAWEDSGGAIYKRLIQQDGMYYRGVTTSVVDINVSEESTARVLLHTAELIERSGSLVEEHRQLSNGRPALVVIAGNRKTIRIKQSTRLYKWTPTTLLLDSGQMYIVGTDTGIYSAVQSTPNINPRPLLTGVLTEEIPKAEPGDSMFPEGSPERTTAEADACVGISSVFEGRRVQDIIKERKDLRLQTHPWRRLREFSVTNKPVNMLCMKWHNKTTSSTLCTTALHVVRWHGNLMYMRDVCKSIKKCSRRKDKPINFKGPCRGDIVAHDFLAVTMHAAKSEDMSAFDLAVAECQEMKRRPIRWLLSTL